MFRCSILLCLYFLVPWLGQGKCPHCVCRSMKPCSPWWHTYTLGTLSMGPSGVYVHGSGHFTKPHVHHYTGHVKMLQRILRGRHPFCPCGVCPRWGWIPNLPTWTRSGGYPTSRHGLEGVGPHPPPLTPSGDHHTYSQQVGSMHPNGMHTCLVSTHVVCERLSVMHPSHSSIWGMWWTE